MSSLPPCCHSVGIFSSTGNDTCLKICAQRAGRFPQGPFGLQNDLEKRWLFAETKTVVINAVIPALSVMAALALFTQSTNLFQFKRRYVMGKLLRVFGILSVAMS